GRSPWTGETIDGDYIKREAQEGRMGEILYAVALKRTGGMDFRAPTDADLRAVKAASEELKRLRPRLHADNTIPTEERFIGPSDRSWNYGIWTFDQLFGPRQLLSIGTYVEELRRLESEVRNAHDGERA